MSGVTGTMGPMTTASLLMLLLGLALGLVLGGVIGWLAQRGRAPEEAAVEAMEARAADQAVVKDGLDRLAARLRDLEQEGAQWQGEFNAQVRAIMHSTDSLRRETASLSTALRKPQVRGAWGEMHLRRAVELAGLVDRCDFTEQVRLDDGVIRPDLVVNLAGGRQVVVDAKVPLDAFMDATDSDDDELRAHHLTRHARQVRNHVSQLSEKAYWRSLPETPDFVVMFVPAEAFLSVALDNQRDLLEYAAERNVVLATPTTLIALLRTVAHGWRHETLAAQVAEVQQLGQELHQRLATMGDHFSKVGRSLGAAVQAYNQTLGSLEGRVLVTARRFNDLGVVDQPLEATNQVERSPRELSAPEFALLPTSDEWGTTPEQDVLQRESARRPEGA